MRRALFRYYLLAAVLYVLLALVLGPPLFAQQINLQTQVKGLLRPSNGGTGIDTSGASGCPKLTGGTWSFNLLNCGSGSTSGVSSFNTRTGAITPSIGDYNFSQIGGSVAIGQLPLATNTTFGIVQPDNATVDVNGVSGLLEVKGGGPFPAQVAPPTPASTTFLQALNNAKNVPVHIAVMGDSFTVACQPLGGPGDGPLNCANRWPEQLRVQLQAIYGSHGTGVYPVIAATSSVINNQAWSCTGSFTTSNILGPTQSSGNTLVALGPGASCTFHDNRNIAWDTLNTYCGTNGSSVGIAVNIDSGAFTGTACGSTTGSAAAHVVTLAATSSISHSVTFTNGAGSGTAYLYAAEGQAGTTGVSVDTLGLGGATSNAVGSAVTTQLAFSDLIPGGTQALIFMDQTNDASLGVPTGTFSTNIQNLITHERALSSAPTVMLAIPPVDVINNTAPMAPYTAVQLGLCASNSLTCINIQDRGTTVGATVVGWGTAFPGCPNVLWDCTGGGSAGIHPNDAGNLDEAQLIYARLVNPVSPSIPATTNFLSAPGGVLTAVPNIFPVVFGGGGSSFNGIGIQGGTGLTSYLGTVAQLQQASSLNTAFNGTNWPYTVNGIAAAFRLLNSSGSDSAFQVSLCPTGTAGAATNMDTTCVAQYMRSSTGGSQAWLNPGATNPTFPANAALVLNPSANWMVDFSGNETVHSVAIGGGTPLTSTQGTGGKALAFSGSASATDTLLLADASGGAKGSSIPVSTLAATGTINAWSARQDFTTISVVTSINNEPGMQVATGTGCSMAASSLATCSATLTLSSPEPDTAYHVVGCTISGSTASVLLGSSGSLTTTNFVVSETNPTTSANSGGTVSCLVIHN